MGRNIGAGAGASNHILRSPNTVTDTGTTGIASIAGVGVSAGGKEWERVSEGT